MNYVAWVLTRWYFWLAVVGRIILYVKKHTITISYEYFSISLASFILMFFIFMILRTLLGGIGKLINRRK
jgi:hypothetical protein